MLQALQFGLGARATRTGRFKSAKAFVRTGAEVAVLRIKVWNTGQFAFRRAELGPFFTILRTIRAAGGGSLEVGAAGLAPCIWVAQSATTEGGAASLELGITLFACLPPSWLV